MKHAKTIRGLRLRYILGLSAIALLVTTSFLMMQHVISKQRSNATLVNLAGHQAGLSNRIAYFVGLMASTDDETEYSMAKSQVGRTINKMRQAHETLLKGDPEKGIPVVTNENLHTIYADPAVGLNIALDNFLTRAEDAYNTDIEDFSLDSASYIYLTTYGPHVLEPLLDAAVDEYESIGKRSIMKIERFEIGIWIATLLMLLIEVLIIFKPLEGNVKKAFHSLEQTISELTNTRKRLISAQKLALVVDWELDSSNGRMSWSDQAFEIFGTTIVTLDSFMELIHPEDRQHLNAVIEEQIHTKTTSRNEFRVIRPDGTERLVYQYTTVKDDDGAGGTLMLMGTIQDITERKELSTRLEKLSEHIPGFIFQCHKDIIGNYKFPYASKGIAETCGVVPEQIEKSSNEFFERVHREDIDRLLASLGESAQKLETWHAKYRVNHPRKGDVWLEGHATPGRLVDGSTLWYGYIWDITERKESEDRIHKLALYDPLTGLANRRLMRDRLSHALAISERSKKLGGLLMLDLDNFKSLNDTKGHETGDALLVEVACRLNKCVRESDTVARLGGDEFVIILENLGDKEKSTRDKAKEIAEKVRVSLGKAYYLQEGEITHHCSSSIGVTIFNGKAINESILLKRADIAMYDAKEGGRNRVCVYNEKRQNEINQKNALILDLQGALEKGEMSLFLQPQLDQGGRLRSAEALLRWFPEGKDPVSPATFIPLAESCDLILSLGEWVLAEACKQIACINKQMNNEDFLIAVNISARQFSDNTFIDKSKKIIGKSGINPKQLKFELTESALVQDIDYVKNVLTELREFGISIELDDFGTGYSSLSSLYHLPINTLKIDRSLVGNIDSIVTTRAIIKATIAMAKAMSMQVIAEGVETPEQNEFLIQEGCDLLQGFYYSKPVPFEDFLLYAGFTKQEVTADGCCMV